MLDAYQQRHLKLLREEHHDAEVVVVGAGVFGCAIAYALANQDRSVLLLERWMHEPDRIVGELLQPGGVAVLRKLGLERCLDDIDAIPCYGYHVLYNGEDVVVPYPWIDSSGRVRVTTNPNAELSEDEKKGDYKRSIGRGFHHGRFISKLRQACLAHPNITVVETEVTATIRGEQSDEVLGVESRTKDPETGVKKPDCYFGQLTIIADGYDSKFRPQLLRKKAEVTSRFYGLELIDCDFSPSHYGHVVIGQAYPVLLYQIGTHETRALIDVPANIPEASPQAGGVRGYIRNFVIPNLPKSAQPSVLAALEENKLKSMPNSYLPPSRQNKFPPGVLLLGDAFNMRHPLGGGGMTVAFSDVALLAELLAPLPTLADRRGIRAAMAEFHTRRRGLTSIINVLAMALYALFAARDRQLRALQRGIFAYFKNGHTDEPLGMMGGLISQPVILARHFFTVAFLAVWLNACDVIGNVWGLWKLPLALADVVLILWRASVVFLPVLWREYR